MKRFRLAFSLPEVLISMGLLSVLSLILVMVIRSNISMERKADTSTEAERAVVVVASELKKALRGALVTSPGSSAEGVVPSLRYRITRVDSTGNLNVDAAGEPIWDSPISVMLDSAGRVLSTQNGQSRVITRLGNAGRLEFERLDGQTLIVRVLAQQLDDNPDFRGKREVRFRIRIPNS